MAEVDILGVNLPANVMLPNSSSTLHIGNALNLSDGKEYFAGIVTRMVVREDGNIHIEVGDAQWQPTEKQPTRPMVGRAILFPSGMVALVRPPRPAPVESQMVKK